MASTNLHTFECDVRGHFKHQSECEKSNVGDLVWLIPEPDNEYDDDTTDPKNEPVNEPVNDPDL